METIAIVKRGYDYLPATSSTPLVNVPYFASKEDIVDYLRAQYGPAGMRQRKFIIVTVQQLRTYGLDTLIKNN